MSPGDLSRLAASLATGELSSGARLVLLSIAAATGPDDVAHLSAGRLGERCGLSTGHVKRLIRELSDAGVVTVERVPGRASKLAVVVPEPAQGGSAGATEGARPRAGGVAPARPVSSEPPRNYSSRRAAGDPGGRRNAGNTTPSTPYEQPTGGQPLRAFMGGRSVQQLIEEAKRDADVPNDPAVAAERKRDVSGARWPGDPVDPIPAVA